MATSQRRGNPSSSNRSRSGQGNGRRPAQQAMQSFTEADREYRKYERREEEDRTGPPDVLLDVPELRVDLIHLELDDLDAHVALKARVLNLVKLDVGVDVHLSRAKLDIKGVQAEVVLKARLDHVAAIVDRLMTSLDRNPELVKGLSRAVSEVGEGAAAAVDMTGDAAKDIGLGTRSALEDVGQGAGAATGDIGEGAGRAVGDVGQGAGQAVGDLGQGAGRAASDPGRLVAGAGQSLGQAGRVAGQALGGVAQGAGQPNGGPPPAGDHGARAKEAAKEVARELGQAATEPARDLGHAATRKLRRLTERRERRRGEKHHATEAAVRTAGELGVDLEQIEGTGRDGRITLKDIRRAREG